MDRSGNVFVADSDNHRVLLFDPNGEPLAQIGGRGSGAGKLDSPADVTVDPNGVVYVADCNNHRIQVFAPSEHAAHGGLLSRLGSAAASYLSRLKR